MNSKEFRSKQLGSGAGFSGRTYWLQKSSESFRLSQGPGLTFHHYSQIYSQTEILARRGATRRWRSQQASQKRFGVFWSPRLWQSSANREDRDQAGCTSPEWMGVLSPASLWTELSVASQAKNQPCIHMQRKAAWHSPQPLMHPCYPVLHGRT